jgi:hypothetical protein
MEVADAQRQPVDCFGLTDEELAAEINREIQRYLGDCEDFLEESPGQNVSTVGDPLGPVPG